MATQMNPWLNTTITNLKEKRERS